MGHGIKCIDAGPVYGSYGIQMTFNAQRDSKRASTDIWTMQNKVDPVDIKFMYRLGWRSMACMNIGYIWQKNIYHSSRLGRSIHLANESVLEIAEHAQFGSI